MKKLLISVNYRDNSGKYYFDSYLKNKVIYVDLEKETIHQVVKNLCEDEGMELTYKGKPQSNVFVDVKDSEPKVIGYVYRGKSVIEDRNLIKTGMGYFDVWVDIFEVVDFPIETIN